MRVPAVRVSTCVGDNSTSRTFSSVGAPSLAGSTRPRCDLGQLAAIVSYRPLAYEATRSTRFGFPLARHRGTCELIATGGDLCAHAGCT